MKKIFNKDESKKIISSVPELDGDSLFLSVFNNNQAIMLLIDPENNQKILDANDSALNFYGYSRKEILKLDMGAINIKPQAELNKLMKKAIEEPNSYYQFVHKTSSGKLKTVEVNASSIEYGNKKVMFIIVHDISELKKSNEQLELAMAGSNMGLWDWWVQTGDLEINERWAEMLGYTREEISPLSDTTWRKLCHPEDMKIVDVQLKKYLEKEIDIYKPDLRMMHKNGSWIWIRTQGQVFEWTDGGMPLRMSGTHLDITERKQIELNIAESEAKFRSFFENSPLSLWIEDTTELVLYIDSMKFKDRNSLTTYFGDHPEEIVKCNKMLKLVEVNSSTLKLYEAENKAELVSNFKNVFTMVSVNFFVEVLASIYDGKHLKSAVINSRTIKGRDIIITIEHSILSKNKQLVTIIDITDQERINRKLAESEKKYKSFFESSPSSLWEQDFSSVMLYLNKLPISGIVELRSYLTKHPEVVKKCIDMVKILDVNSATLEMYEAQSKEDLFWNLGNIFTEEAYENFKEELLCIYNKDQVFSAETNGKTLKGKIIRSRIDLVMLSDYKVLVTITDITEQKLLEKNLTESEAKFRSYFESSPLSLWEEDYSDVIEYLHNLPVSDVSELKVYLEKHSKDVKKCLSLIKILNANKATLDLYDLESKPGNLFEYTRKSSQSGFDTFIEELISLYIKKPLITLYFQDETRKGNIIDVKLEMRLLSDYKYLVTIVDLTEIKKNELFLSKILAQTKADSETKEILLREINHRVKNHLSSFIGMLYAEKKQSGTDSNTVQMEHVDNLINRVKGISLAHELLSKSQWAPISINKLTEKIIHSLQHLIPKDRIVDVKLKPSDIFLDADQSHNTAILINELFTNTIEHASHPGENLVVEIEINKTKESITLLYRDNGPGYPDEILNSEFYNVGMYLIKNIVEQSLRGVFKISNDNGAKIEIEFPGGSKLEEL